MNLNHNESYYDDYFKVIVVGDTATGKTSLVQAYDKGMKQNKIIPTIGIQYCSKVIQIGNNRKVKIQIWDTAGQEQYRAITMSHYRNAVGALVVFDVGNRNSFNSIPRWVKDIRQRSNQNVVIGIVANKTDIPVRAISRQDGQSMASKQQAFYMETSFNDIQSIRNVFDRIAQEVYRNNSKQNLSFSRTNVQLQSNPVGKTQKDNNCQC